MLVIQYLGNDEKVGFCFNVHRGNAEVINPVSLPDPRSYPIERMPNSNLAYELAWYLEQFLSHPYHPSTDRAKRVLEARKKWGEACFTALFGEGEPKQWYQQLRDKGLENLTIKIASDDPKILSWPWEALQDPKEAPLAHVCHIERKLDKELNQPIPVSESLAKNSINILLIISRPKGDNDVGYHAISRPMVELSRDVKSSVNVDVLRPPTFAQLRNKLQERPHYYHIVHFDGHGGYGNQAEEVTIHGLGVPQSFSVPIGKLYFEDENSKPDPVAANKLAVLLNEFRIPIVVLNACRSAAMSKVAEDSSSSVATALMKAGVRSVVAMGYNLLVTGAKRFVPAFYERLYSTGRVDEAVRAGRQEMLAKPGRICSRGEFPLQDWLVPVLYQQDPLVLNFAGNAPQQEQEKATIPNEARLKSDYGFIGRERAVLGLERALRKQKQGALLIHGMAGVGKTTLAQGFLQWLQDTGGLTAGVFWFGFESIRSSNAVINQLVDAFFGTNAMAAADEDKDRALIEELKQKPLLIVWDNFESASGIPGTEVEPLLSENDRERLKNILNGIRGGKSKILITSRSSESWLSTQLCFRLPLTGLEGEECWQYCNEVVADLNLSLDRNNPDYAEIIAILGGHPLAMRAVLLRLQQTKNPSALLKELKNKMDGQEGDESTKKILSALSLFDKGLKSSFGPVLQLVSLHRQYVDKGFIENMVKSANIAIETELITECFTALEAGGLLHPMGNNIYSMHPAIVGHLQLSHPAEESVKRGFVDIMGWLADSVVTKELHEKRPTFFLFAACFHQALGHAKSLGMQDYINAITQSLAVYAQNNRDFTLAQRLLQEFAEYCKKQNNEKLTATAYHHRGMIAQEQRDFANAEDWYKKSLNINERLGNEQVAALTYHQLGRVAEEQQDFAKAKDFYKKSLDINERLGNEQGAANTYHQLGMIAEEQQDFNKAEDCYKNSLDINERLGNEQGAASTYHQLGMIAEKQQDFDNAEVWYKKSLNIKERLGNVQGTAKTYHQLGMIAKKKQDFDNAEVWYKKALEIKERLGNEHGAAITQYMLGH
ncbi:MAG: tetratricopeptide repeat protein [Magnetococcales bacterium]|nr:tetratricopeptide repeat protein [Magnetococcales bacterium]